MLLQLDLFRLLAISLWLLGVRALTHLNKLRILEPWIIQNVSRCWTPVSINREYALQ
jgi:hypothetical protein